MEMGDTVIYRRNDMLNMIERLRALGHKVELFSIAPDSHFFDYYVDVPPYSLEPHLKLQIAQYVSTSVGIVIRKCWTSINFTGVRKPPRRICGVWPVRWCAVVLCIITIAA